MNYDIIIKEQVLDAPIKGSKKENWVTLKAPHKPFYKNKDSDLFSFLAGTEGRMNAYKPHTKWEGVDVNLKIKHVKYRNHTVYTLKELKRVENLYKAYISAYLPQIKDDPTKQVTLSDFFYTTILRGEFYLTEGYLDYRVLLCFTR